MDDKEKSVLADMVVAPYIQKATALIGLARKVGGNQFRHVMATFSILIDYHYTDSVLLKASLLHDLIEDTDDTDIDEIASIDGDGPEVVKLVLEVTRDNESKEEYLENIMDSGSERSKILKVADRISNLTDLHADVFNKEFIKKYIDQTEKFILPIAKEVNNDMAIEVLDLIKRRRKLIE